MSVIVFHKFLRLRKRTRHYLQVTHMCTSKDSYNPVQVLPILRGTMSVPHLGRKNIRPMGPKRHPTIHGHLGLCPTSCNARLSWSFLRFAPHHMQRRSHLYGIRLTLSALCRTTSRRFRSSPIHVLPMSCHQCACRAFLAPFQAAVAQHLRCLHPLRRTGETGPVTRR